MSEKRTGELTGESPLRVLIFGHSDTIGVGLSDRGKAWPRLLGQQLKTADLRDAEIIHRRFNILRPGPLEYLDAEVGEHNPDVFVFPLTSTTFSLPLVRIAVRRRFGARAERVYLRLEGRVSDSVAPQSWFQRRANAAAKRLARTVLGQATHMPLATAIEMYGDVLRRLAAHEGLRVIVKSASLRPESFQKREPWAKSQIESFNNALREVAGKHRMEWLDYEELLARSGDRAACYAPDEVHKSEFGHAHIAREMAAVIAHGR